VRTILPALISLLWSRANGSFLPQDLNGRFGACVGVDQRDAGRLVVDLHACFFPPPRHANAGLRSGACRVESERVRVKAANLARVASPPPSLAPTTATWGSTGPASTGSTLPARSPQPLAPPTTKTLAPSAVRAAFAKRLAAVPAAAAANAQRVSMVVPAEIAFLL